MIEQVKVEWIDSKYHSHEWLTLEEIKALDVGYCVSIGVLVFEDEDKITLAQNANIDCETYHHFMTIPKCAVKRISELRG